MSTSAQMTSVDEGAAKLAAVRAGLSRGWLETRQSLTSPTDLIWYFFFPLTFLVVLLFMRDSTVPGTSYALSAMVLPSLIGMTIAQSGLTGPAGTIIGEREDGTLLRAKATPNGMLGYLVGKIVSTVLTLLASLVLMIIPATLVLGDLRFGEPRAWVIMVGVFLLGLMATVPISAALGSLMTGSQQMGLLMLATLLLIAPSGIFYPITALPVWLQWVGQMFPFYWTGLGIRSALLPEAMVAAEIGGSWRAVQMVVVLGIWAVAGLLLAPVLMRRMARRQSGSKMAEAREKMLNWGN
jgi:ABC-2 type transport system permease protein